VSIFGALMLTIAGISPARCTAQSRDLETLPTAKEIIDRMIERTKKLEHPELAARYLFQQHYHVERLDGDGAVKEREERRLEAVRIQDRLFLRLAERNGRPLEGRELEREREREKKFREELSKPRKPRPEQQLDFDRELTEKFRAEVIGREAVNGRMAYVLRFEPKSKNLPVRKFSDRLTNKLAGTLWVDAQDYQIVRAEGRLTETARIGLGIIGSISKFDFKMEQTRLDETTWMPSRLDLYIQARALFRSIHQRATTRWDGFHKAVASGE
jgi:hypothetical protein